MKNKVVHKVFLTGEYEDMSACGLFFVANPTLTWEQVTCKRCLSKRGGQDHE